MTIHYTIQATVVDIQTDTPNKKDVFLVDSNVWYWMTYPNAGQSGNPYQIADYPAYVNQALIAGSGIYWSGLSLAELSHLIERTEREIYEGIHGSVQAKEYRHNLHAEHTRVVSEVEAAWVQIRSLGESLDTLIDETTTNAVLNRFKTQSIDGYDLFMLETMARHNVIQIITDDGDFATIPGIQVFTANRSVLNSARDQGKRITR